MLDIFYDKAQALKHAGTPFALAVVVRHEAPISGKPGDKAIILSDGSLHGWIGGGCTQPVIVKEARKALEDGNPRLVRITPTASEVFVEGIKEYPMTCYSGGALDIYIEPIMPKPQLVVLGHSIVAQALVRLGRVMSYRVVVHAPGATAELFPNADVFHNTFDLAELTQTPQTFVVVSTQGHGDEEALEAIADLDVPYAAFVASRRKAAQVFANLEERGIAADQLAGIRTPAGLDIGARLPEEIAVSVLAEVVGELRGKRIETQFIERESDRTAVVDATRVTLAIGEMTCAHCMQRVQKTLESVEGVTVHDVEIGTAEVSFDPATGRREAIAEALADKGYVLLPTTPAEIATEELSGAVA